MAIVNTKGALLGSYKIGNTQSSIEDILDVIVSNYKCTPKNTCFCAEDMGFPTSSVAFKNLMIAMSDRYHLVAPDYPGFGFSEFSIPDDFDYTFAGISALINK
ncbi:MAG TPA: alpha/beta fold hydrolase, partial [Dyadobacter sp.]|nr:alpha/beta fold hydrolase [Dyadobacter sp.]